MLSAATALGVPSGSSATVLKCGLPLCRCLLFVLPWAAKDEKWTHHPIGICVTSFRHRETLDNFWGHPRESSNQRHVCCMIMEPRGTKIAYLRKEKQVSTFYYWLRKDLSVTKTYNWSLEILLKKMKRNSPTFNTPSAAITTKKKERKKNYDNHLICLSHLILEEKTP